MKFWAGFFEALKSYSKWREARNAQKKRFLVTLADGKALAIMQEVAELRADLKTHVEAYHGGKKPPKPKKEEAQEAAFADWPMSKEEMESWIYGGG
jgi:membrane-anchored protein YejM (alkaline phosphatase superfamily)